MVALRTPSETASRRARLCDDCLSRPVGARFSPLVISAPAYARVYKIEKVQPPLTRWWAGVGWVRRGGSTWEAPAPVLLNRLPRSPRSATRGPIRARRGASERKLRDR